jgi:hypothetical protein
MNIAVDSSELLLLIRKVPSSYLDTKARYPNQVRREFHQRLQHSPSRCSGSASHSRGLGFKTPPRGRISSTFRDFPPVQQSETNVTIQHLQPLPPQSLPRDLFITNRSLIGPVSLSFTQKSFAKTKLQRYYICAGLVVRAQERMNNTDS